MSKSLTQEHTAEHQFKYDFYTTIPGGRAVGVTDGMAGIDNGWAANKVRREGPFPKALAKKSMEVCLETGDSSMPMDKTHILNALAGRKGADLDAAPLKTHPAYTQVNAILRGRFALAMLGAAAQEGGPFLDSVFKAMKNSSMVLSKNFFISGIGQRFSADFAVNLCASFPQGIHWLRFEGDTLPSNFGQAFVSALQSNVLSSVHFYWFIGSSLGQDNFCTMVPSWTR